ncbi:general transcription factor 3C polypeptide 3 isoform X2 [Jatropha curcas]|nr:general transcription factor 3C polypeptide 3 isoform X2 [Jatropha curcas]
MKSSQEFISGAIMDEIMEAMSYGIRRKSRKSKKKGRRRGSKNKLSPEITKMLGDGTVLYAHGRYEEAISILNEVVRLEPRVPDSYHTLGLVHMALGNAEKAMGFYTIAARLMPKDSPLWRMLFSWYNERGDLARAWMYLSKAIRADPNDITLRVLQASIYVKLGDFQRAAESYEQISQIFPEDVEALKKAAKLYLDCGQKERCINILENYLKAHPSEADSSVIDLLASILMETNAHNNALQHIENAHLVYYSGREMPLQLKIKAGICHIYLGNIEQAEVLFSNLELENASNNDKVFVDIPDAFMKLGHFHAALKYYHMLESNAGVDNEGYICLKIAQCYLSLKDRVKAIMFFYKALHALEDSIDCRLALASLILEDGKEDEAISLLSPPESLDSVNLSSDRQKQWWLDGRIKLKICHIYRAKGMFEEFVNTIFPLVRESLYVKTLRQKVKRRLTISVLRERTKILDVGETVDVFGGVRPLAAPPDLAKASRARRLLQKKEEKKAEARAAGIDWHSDDSDDEPLEEVRVPPLPNFLKDEEHHNLIIDLCKALQMLQRYWEALEIINLTRSLACEKLPVEKREELQSLAAQISYKTTDPKHGFDCVKSVIIQHPYSLAAWNCYYKITSRLGKNYSRHAKFLRHMRSKHDDCVSPIVIYGHQFTLASHHQDAAREYLAAYKLLPENPLINLCVGTALINLTLGFRLQNKHQCLAQGLSFLYNNLRLAENSQESVQEALYNVGRACHQVGLLSLAASYYEKVLKTSEKDYPIPKLLNENLDAPESLKPGYCDLRKEAAYNLHLIYKKSGALDLARQVLKDHCTF